MTKISTQVEKISGEFLKLYFEQMIQAGQKEPVRILQEIFEFENDPDKTFLEYKDLTTKFLDGRELSTESVAASPNFLIAMAQFAKIQDAFRRIRNIANQEYYDSEIKDSSADSWNYTFKRFAEKEITASEAQALLDHVKISTATTSHPTNPTSVEYTDVAMKLGEVLVKLTAPDCDHVQVHSELNQAIRNLVETPMSQKKKTQQDEVAEGMLYLDSVYDSIGVVLADFEEKKAQHVEYHNLKLPENFYEPCVWITGDGDGNPNSTELTLRHNISEFRKRIRGHYTNDLKAILAKISRDNISANGVALAAISLKLQDPAYKVEEFQKDLDAAISGAAGSVKSDLEKLRARSNIFGFHFAKIDIRHESTDIMKATLGLLIEIKEMPEVDNLDKLKAGDVKKLFDQYSDKLKSDDVFEKIARLQTGEIKSELTRRIFGRLRAIAENPDMSNKMIIAEFKGAANAEATLFLLKAAGNEVGNEKARMNITPLAEEVDTLKALSGDLRSILQNPDYWNHVKETKNIYFMIAKSDTVRRDGIGAQFYQEKAVQDSIKEVLKVLIEKDPQNFEQYTVHPYNGGGHALQRGGGRLSELPSVYGRYALKAIRELEEEYKDQPEILEKLKKARIDAPCFTVQGHQNGLLLHPFTVGAGTLSALTSQALYAEARLRGALPDLEVENSADLDDDAKADLLKRATAAREICCNNAIEAYGAIKDGTGPINRLFYDACWIAVKLNNKSSRASVRGMGEGGIEAGTTFADLKGGQNKMLEQRAIGAEKLNSHSGAHLISWFSIKEGLEQVKQSGVCSLNEMYRGTKATRDAMRGISTSLFMVDFSISWPMMCGSERRKETEIDALNASYMQKVADAADSITKEETLAFIEVQHRETLKLVYETIYGIEPGPDTDIKNAILAKWPEMRDEIKERESKNRFAHMLEAQINDMSNKNPNAEVNPEIINLIESCYCGSDVTNAPLGILLGLTKDRNRESQLTTPSTPESPLEINFSTNLGKVMSLPPLATTSSFSAAKGSGQQQVQVQSIIA